MVTYTKTTWVNDQAPAINDTNLNNIETGLENLYHEFDANSVLKADSDNTPIKLTVAASTFLGRKAAGNIAAMTVAEAKTLLAIVVADISDHDKAAHDALDIAPASHGADKHTNRTAKIWIPCTNATDGLDLNSGVSGGKLTDGAYKFGYANFCVPEDFVSSGVIKAVVSPDGTGNMKYGVTCYYAANGQSQSTHYNSSGSQTEGVSIDFFNVLAGSVSLTSLAKGDYISILIYRHGEDANDTVNADVILPGFVFEYTADQ